MELKQAERHSDCPASSVLIDWFDGTLDAQATDHVEEHLDRCASCRTWLDDWSERSAGVAAQVSADCPDAETLVAYCTASPSADPAGTARVERHLRECEACVRAVAHIMTLEQQRQRSAAPAAAAAASPARVRTRAAGREVMEAAAAWWQRLRETLMPNVWAGSALAATAALVLALGVSRLMQPAGPAEEMRLRGAQPGVTVEIAADTVGRVRPSAAEPVVAQLERGTQARRLEASNGWTRIELADGRRVWVQTETVAARRNAGAAAAP